MFRGFGFLLLSILLGTASALAQFKWSTPVVIDSEAGVSARKPLARDDRGMLYTCYTNIRSGNMVVAHSTDEGATWMKWPFETSDRARWSEDIAVDHLGNVWLLWISNFEEFTPYYVNISKSTDSGKTFHPFFFAKGYSDGHPHPKFAIDDENSIYLLWYDVRLTLTKFLYGNSSKQNDKFLRTGGYYIDANTDIALGNDHSVHCVWEGYTLDSSAMREHIFYGHSTDRGQSFAGPTRIDTQSTFQYQPAVAVDSSGNVYVSYSRVLGLNVARRNRDAEDFEPPALVQRDTLTYESRLCIDSQGGVNLIWIASHLGYLNWRSTDQGRNFEVFAKYPLGLGGLSGTSRGMLFATGIDFSDNFCFTSAAVVLGAPEQVDRPVAVGLMQNYPNPFNPTSTITYQLPTESHVHLTISNVLGQEVRTLVNATEQSGEKTVRFDASGLPSGIYFYRLDATSISDPTGNFAQTRKMLLVK